MIVVDTNVIGYLYLGSAYSEQAERALLKDAEWAAPSGDGGQTDSARFPP